MTRVAAVDCGTNSLRLLVTDLDPDAGTAAELERHTRIVRLGQDVDQTRRFAPEALRRTFAVLGDYERLARHHGVEQIRMVATSAARDVTNRDEFVAGVESVLGVAPEVISGDEEAALSYAGAIRGLGPAAPPEPLVIVDIGGGSTEFVSRAADQVVGRSLDIGSVRLTERHVGHDPPTDEEVDAVRHAATAAMDALADLDLGPSAVAGHGTVVGVAGTVTTVAAMVLDLPEYDRSRVDGARLAAADVAAAVDRLAAMTVAERRELPFMLPGRADVIVTGGLVLTAALDRLGAGELVVSEHDILDGIAWSLVS